MHNIIKFLFLATLFYDTSIEAAKVKKEQVGAKKSCKELVLEALEKEEGLKELSSEEFKAKIRQTYINLFEAQPNTSFFSTIFKHFGREEAVPSCTIKVMDIITNSDRSQIENVTNENLTKYFTNKAFTSDLGLKDRCIHKKQKSYTAMLEEKAKNTKIDATFPMYCQIIEDLCFVNLNLLSEVLDSGERILNISSQQFTEYLDEIKKRFNLPPAHTSFIVEHAFIDAFTYLFFNNIISNPYSKKWSEDAVKESIKYIKNIQKTENYKKDLFEELTDVVYIPGSKVPSNQSYYRAVIQDATDSERYKVKVQTKESIVQHQNNVLALARIGKTFYNDSYVLLNPEFIGETHYRRATIREGIEASSFDPRALYGVLDYIKDYSGPGQFETMPKLKTFYDPCGGWGERFTSAAFLDREGQNFESIKVNDLNHDLKNGYEKLKQRISQDLKESKKPEKKITFTYRDALTHDSGPNDFIFTGFPFFSIEQYPHANLSYHRPHLSVQKNKEKAWIKNWMVPLLHKLIKTLNPGGILAFNLCDYKEHPLLTQLKKELDQDEAFQSNVTPYSFSLWSKIFYTAHGKGTAKVEKHKETGEKILPALTRIIILQKAHPKPELSSEKLRSTASFTIDTLEK